MITDICREIVPRFPSSTVGLVILHPFVERSFEWTHIPECIKEAAEMSFLGPSEQGLYDIYGVSPDKGALVVVRPDGVVGAVSFVSNTAEIDTYLGQCLLRI